MGDYVYFKDCVQYPDGKTIHLEVAVTAIMICLGLLTRLDGEKEH